MHCKYFPILSLHLRDSVFTFKSQDKGLNVVYDKTVIILSCIMLLCLLRSISTNHLQVASNVKGKGNVSKMYLCLVIIKLIVYWVGLLVYSAELVHSENLKLKL